MIVINSSTFRANQSKYFNMASEGQRVIVTRNNRKPIVISAAEDYEAVPTVDITDTVVQGLREIAAIRRGEKKSISLNELLNEL